MLYMHEMKAFIFYLVICICSILYKPLYLLKKHDDIERIVLLPFYSGRFIDCFVVRGKWSLFMEDQ